MEHISRRQQRIWTLQALFELNFRQIDANEVIANLEERYPETIHAPYTHRLIPLVYENITEVDAQIEKFSKEWRIDRMPRVDLSILRIAIAEMLYIEEIKDSVVINEAIELAKEFGTVKSSKFINGVLGALSHYLLQSKEERK